MICETIMLIIMFVVCSVLATQMYSTTATAATSFVRSFAYTSSTISVFHIQMVRMCSRLASRPPESETFSSSHRIEKKKKIKEEEEEKWQKTTETRIDRTIVCTVHTHSYISSDAALLFDALCRDRLHVKTAQAKTKRTKERCRSYTMCKSTP